jgi:hypothetical protein
MYVGIAEESPKARQKPGKIIDDAQHIRIDDQLMIRTQLARHLPRILQLVEFFVGETNQKVFTGPELIRAICSHRTQIDPPLKNAPSGTSAIKRNRTSSKRSRSRSIKYYSVLP